jgi:hypothetical protein
MNTAENIPQVWDDERDCPFFRLTGSLFSSEFCYGAGVLLASYDAEDLNTIVIAGNRADAALPFKSRRASTTPASA